MATLAIESAVLASCGNVVVITWRAAAPPQRGVVDWLAGYNAGKWFDVASRAVVRHLSTCQFLAPDGSLEWQTHLRIGAPIVYGTASATLSVDAGLLSDAHGNVNAGVTNYAIDVTRTLVDSTGFLDLSITPGAGGFKVYVNPEDGALSPTLAGIKTTAGAARSFNALTDLLIANELQDKGCHILYLQGKTDTRTHAQAYPAIRSWGPSASKPCLIAVADGAGNLAASGARANIRLSNNGVSDGYLFGIRRDTGGVSDCPNVCINGFDIRCTDLSGTSQGSGIDVSNGATNFSVFDTVVERVLTGLVLQATTPWVTISDVTLLDSVGVNSRRAFGIYSDKCPKGMVFNNVHFDRNGKSLVDLSGGENQLRDVYISRHGRAKVGGLATGPVCITGGIHLRGQDTTVQNREGHCSGMLFVECPGAGHAGGRGGGGWSMTTVLEAGDFINENRQVIPCSRGPYINNSIVDSDDGSPSDNEGSSGGILEANCMYARTGTARYNELAFSVLGSNLVTKREYVNRHNVTRGVGPIQMNSKVGKALGLVTQSGNVVDARGALRSLVLSLGTNMTADGWGWMKSSNNLFFADDIARCVLTEYLGDVFQSLTWWKGLTGSSTDASGSPPVYRDAARTIGSWAALQGVTDKAGFINAVRTRGYRQRLAACDVFAAVEYFLAGLEVTNYAPFQTGWFDRHGAPKGLPTARMASAPAGPSATLVLASDGFLFIFFDRNITFGTVSGSLEVGSRDSISLFNAGTTIGGGNTAALILEGRGIIYAGETLVLNLDAGSFMALSGGAASLAYVGPVTNTSDVVEPTRPGVVAARCSDQTIQVDFNQNVRFNGSSRGTLSVAGRGVQNLAGLAQSIAGTRLFLTLPSYFKVYVGDSLTLDLKADAVASQASGLTSAAYLGAATNTSVVNAPSSPSVVSASVDDEQNLTVIFSEAVSEATGTTDLSTFGTLTVGTRAVVTLNEIVPVYFAGLSATRAVFNFTNRGSVYAGESLALVLGAGCVASAASGAVNTAYTGACDNNATLNTPTTPAVLSAACTALALAVTFDENIALGPRVLGSLTVGSRAVFALSTLVPQISGAVVTFNTASLGTVYTSEEITLSLAESSFSSNDNGGLSLGFVGVVTNNSSTASGETPAVVSAVCTSSTLRLTFNVPVTINLLKTLRITVGARIVYFINALNTLVPTVVGTTVTYDLRNEFAIYAGESVSVFMEIGYAVAVSGGATSALYNGVVTNQSTNSSAGPTLVSALVDASGETLRLVFSEPVRVMRAGQAWLWYGEEPVIRGRLSLNGIVPRITGATAEYSIRNLTKAYASELISVDLLGPCFGAIATGSSNQDVVRFAVTNQSTYQPSAVLPWQATMRLAGSPAISIMRARGRRSRVLMIDSDDLSASPDKGVDLAWYERFNPERNAGAWCTGLIDNNVVGPMHSAAVDLTNVVLGPAVYSHRREKQENVPGHFAGLFYDTASTAGTGVAGVSGFQIGLCGISQEVLFSSTTRPADGQVLFTYTVINLGTASAWTKGSVKWTFFWHEPAAAAASGASGRAITGGPSFDLGIARNFDAPVAALSVTGGTSNLIRWASVVVPAGSNAESVTLAVMQPVGGGASVNLGRRMVPLGVLCESVDAAEGLSIVRFSSPFTSHIDWSLVGANSPGGDDVSGGGVKVSSLLDSINTAVGKIDAVIFSLGSYLSTWNLFDGTDDYGGLTAGYWLPEGSHWAESYTDLDNAIRSHLNGVGAAKPNRVIPLVILHSHWAGWGSSLAQARTAIDAMHRGFEWFLSLPDDGSINSLKYGTVNTMLLDPWAGVTPEQMLTGQGATKFIRGASVSQLSGTTVRDVYNASTAYAVGDVVVHAAAAFWERSNGGWYRCKLASTGNAPPNVTFWDRIDASLTDNGWFRVVDFARQHLVLSSAAGGLNARGEALSGRGKVRARP